MIVHGSRRLVLCFLSMTPLGACEREAPQPTLSVTCREDAPSVFLSSKADDDDGDGLLWDDPSPLINDEDDDIADHAWVRDAQGTFHLYFQNEGHAAGSDIEHYTSTDLQSLDYVGRALQRNPGAWDSEGLWAPHVVERDGVYFMFYTGVSGSGEASVQRIGVAASTDLEHWTRLPENRCADAAGDGCVYTCDEVWTTWGRSAGSYDRQCRDPFVVWDDANARWVLFATAKSRNEFGVITVAYSSDLVHWTGAGFIDASRRVAGAAGARARGGQAENPHVMTYAGTHYLLFSDWQDPEDPAGTPNPRTMTQYATSPHLRADASGSLHWTYRGSIPDPGVNAIEVQRIGDTFLMTQSISNETSGDFIHRRELRLRCVRWKPGLRFDTVNVEIAPVERRSANPVAVPNSGGRAAW